MLVGCYLLGIDSKNPVDPEYAEFVGMEDEFATPSALAARDYRYGVICNVRTYTCTHA